jgi:hypothetical protein
MLLKDSQKFFSFLLGRVRENIRMTLPGESWRSAKVVDSRENRREQTKDK